MIHSQQPSEIHSWPIERLVFYARNPRRQAAAVDRMVAPIREYGFQIPVLARSDGEVVGGHLRRKAFRKLGITEVPVILCDECVPWPVGWEEAFLRAVQGACAGYEKLSNRQRVAISKWQAHPHE